MWPNISSGVEISSKQDIDRPRVLFVWVLGMGVGLGWDMRGKEGLEWHFMLFCLFLHAKSVNWIKVLRILQLTYSNSAKFVILKNSLLNSRWNHTIDKVSVYRRWGQGDTNLPQQDLTIFEWCLLNIKQTFIKELINICVVFKVDRDSLIMITETNNILTNKMSWKRVCLIQKCL